MAHKSSFVWKYFKLPHKDSAKATCLFCGASISRGGTNSRGFTTTNLSRHLRSFHHNGISQCETSSCPASPSTSRSSSPEGISESTTCTPTVIAKQETITSMFQKKSKLEMSHPRYIKITKLIAEMMCLDIQPFSIVEDRGFTNLIAYLEPRYKLPNRTTFSRKLIPDLYMEVREETKKLLSQATSISLTVDMWSSVAKQDYMSLTAHFVDTEWVRKELCLEVVPFMHTHHTATNLSTFILEVIGQWGISTESIHCIVSDNARNLVAATDLMNVKRIPCTAHTMQLVLNNALFNLRPVNDMCARARRVVGHFKHSLVANKKLTQFQEANDLPKHHLIQDEPTRWDSTYHMLERLYTQRKAVMFLLPELKLNTDISSSNWILMEKTVSVLETFNKVTLVVSNSDTTISEVIPIVNGLRLDLSNNTEKILADGIKSIIYHLDMYYKDIEENELFAFATILDPRFKASVFRSKESSQAMKQKLLDTLEAEQHEDTSDNTATETSVEVAASSSPGLLTGIYKKLISANTYDTDTHLAPSRELDQYLSESLSPTDSNPVEYWKHSHHLQLRKLAQKFLSPPAASVVSERLFSSAGLISGKTRSSLHPEKLKMLVFLNKNLKYVCSGHK